MFSANAITFSLANIVVFPDNTKEIRKILAQLQQYDKASTPKDILLHIRTKSISTTSSMYIKQVEARNARLYPITNCR